MKERSRMFTLEEVTAAHAKVKSGADFPAYIQELKQLGVSSYDTFVRDGSTTFYAANGEAVTWPPKYRLLEIAPAVQEDQFLADLKAHQAGKTNYATFCQAAANAGISKWQVAISDLTCTYLDSQDNAVLVETIGQ